MSLRQLPLAAIASHYLASLDLAAAVALLSLRGAVREAVAVAGALGPRRVVGAQPLAGGDLLPRCARFGRDLQWWSAAQEKRQNELGPARPS